VELEINAAEPPAVNSNPIITQNFRTTSNEAYISDPKLFATNPKQKKVTTA
jgi:hypothetical protein